MSKLSRHEMFHIRDGTLHECEFCGKKLPYHTWIRHVASHKKGKAPKVRCNICHKSVTCIKQHMKIMHQERERFTCQQCGKTFAEQRFLTRHETIHTKSFRFNCDKCDKGYNVKCALEYHVDTVHTRIKRYVCKVPGCHESFFVNLYLRRHMARFHPEMTTASE